MNHKTISCLILFLITSIPAQAQTPLEDCYKVTCSNTPENQRQACDLAEKMGEHTMLNLTGRKRVGKWRKSQFVTNFMEACKTHSSSSLNKIALSELLKDCYQTESCGRTEEKRYSLCDQIANDSEKLEALAPGHIGPSDAIVWLIGVCDGSNANKQLQQWLQTCYETECDNQPNQQKEACDEMIHFGDLRSRVELAVHDIHFRREQSTVSIQAIRKLIYSCNGTSKAKEGKPLGTLKEELAACYAAEGCGSNESRRDELKLLCDLTSNWMKGIAQKAPGVLRNQSLEQFQAIAIKRLTKSCRRTQIQDL